MKQGAAGSKGQSRTQTWCSSRKKTLNLHWFHAVHSSRRSALSFGRRIDLALCATLELIILDADLHDQSSWKQVKALRHDPRLIDVPLILILAAAPTPSQQVPLQPVRWVEKPLAKDALLALVQESLAWAEAELGMLEKVPLE